MIAGFAVFLIAVATGVIAAAVMARRTTRHLGPGAAVKEAAVTGGSVAVYAATCLWLGYGARAQAVAAALSAAGVLAGARWVPALRDSYTKGEQ